MNPIRMATVAGSTQTYEFDVIATQVLIKNMSGGNVTVALEPETVDEDSRDTWLLPDGAWQIIPSHESGVSFTKVYVAADADSDDGVEVEAVEFRLPNRN
ncbi:MAG: hypothetical protein LUC83_08300 [Clostridiales bacterium]|nr:hypothetical protein [Clostridiales bacterium]